jgi:hypothetical protein
VTKPGRRVRVDGELCIIGAGYQPVVDQPSTVRLDPPTGGSCLLRGQGLSLGPVLTNDPRTGAAARQARCDSSYTHGLGASPQRDPRSDPVHGRGSSGARVAHVPRGTSRRTSWSWCASQLASRRWSRVLRRCGHGREATPLSGRDLRPGWKCRGDGGQAKAEPSLGHKGGRESARMQHRVRHRPVA